MANQRANNACYMACTDYHGLSPEGKWSNWSSFRVGGDPPKDDEDLDSLCTMVRKKDPYNDAFFFTYPSYKDFIQDPDMLLYSPCGFRACLHNGPPVKRHRMRRLIETSGSTVPRVNSTRDAVGDAEEIVEVDTPLGSKIALVQEEYDATDNSRDRIVLEMLDDMAKNAARNPSATLASAGSEVCHMSVAVVGGGHAAGHIVGALRMNGYDGPIRIVGEDPLPPYQRPPISKSYLACQMDLEQVYLKPLGICRQNGADLTLGCRVERIVRGGQCDCESDGLSIPYGKLVLASGARVRRLALRGSDFCGIHYLRSMADADTIGADMHPGTRLVVCGGGCIGLEIAAAAAWIHAIVTVLEMADRAMNRMVAPVFYEGLHAGKGVDTATSVQVSVFEGEGRSARVATTDGRLSPADVVVIGVGVVPNIELAEAAGLPCDDGILVDPHGQTEDLDILACGDCTNHPNGIYGVNVRFESVQNAVDQATAVAKEICDVRHSGLLQRRSVVLVRPLRHQPADRSSEPGSR